MFRIVDRETRRAHIERWFATRDLAEAERADLLRPYPEGHVWRARLVILAFGEVLPPKPKRDYRRPEAEKAAMRAAYAEKRALKAANASAAPKGSPCES